MGRGEGVSPYGGAVGFGSPSHGDTRITRDSKGNLDSVRTEDPANDPCQANCLTRVDLQEFLGIEVTNLIAACAGESRCRAEVLIAQLKQEAQRA